MGLDDAFLVKFDSGGVRQWGTYYGGSGYDQGGSCTIDGSGNIYIAGRTSTTGNGISTIGAHQNLYGGGLWDAFLIKFNSNGVRQWGTYYGGAGSEDGVCATDSLGNIFITGMTESNSGTVIATFGAHQTTYAGGRDAFIVKFNNNGVRQWGTYYGGSGYDIGTSCTTDSLGNSYLTGFTQTHNSTDIATFGAHQSNFGGGLGGDAFLVKFNSSGQRQWGTYYGGTEDDYALACLTDGSGIIYMAGQVKSNSGNVIATSNSHQSVHGGGTWDSFLVKFASCQQQVLPMITVNDTLCVGGDIYFNTIITGASSPSYSWIGPASFTSSVQNPSITSISPVNLGIYTLTVNNGVCVETATILVASDEPTIVVESGTVCIGESFSIVPSGANTYTISGGNFMVSPNVTTTYSVTGTSIEGCVSNVAVSTIMVDACVGVSENSSIHPSCLKIYPNPNNGQFSVDSDTEAMCFIFDIQGRIVSHQSLVSGKNQISIEHLENGVYFLEVSLPKGKEVFRIIKQ